MKSQVVIETQSLKIIRSAHGTGKEHDFQLFKRSKVKPIESIEVLADKGYQGINKIHGSSYVPFKKPRKRELTSLEKEYNRELAKHRIYVEHVIRCLKIFRILAQPYAALMRHRPRIKDSSTASPEGASPLPKATSANSSSRGTKRCYRT